MISQGVVVGILAVAAYAASTAIEIELPNTRRTSPSAAFGPPLAAVGVGGYAIVSSVWLFAASLAAEMVIVCVIRRRPMLSVAHALGLMLSFSFVIAYGRVGLSVGRERTIGLLAVAGLAAVAYAFADICIESLTTSHVKRWRTVLVGNLRSAVPLVVVMASTAGLIVLVLPRLTWAAFPVLFVPVLATRHEFERYGKAQRTYDETVRALAGLTEGAGYVPQGHQARVADLCVKIGREMSLSAERLRELELVALLHDVGAVSLSDPADVADVDPEEIARSTGRMLEETEYLERYAAIVLDAARGTRDLPVEGRILRVADAYDRYFEDGDDAASIERAVAPEDAEVVAALRRVLEYS